MRIILVAAFGLAGLHKTKLPYILNGTTHYFTIDIYLRKLTSFMMFRGGRYLFSVIPYMMFFFYSKEDREYKANIKTMRNFCENIINERK